jgi:hypothetical protein
MFYFKVFQIIFKFKILFYHIMGNYRVEKLSKKNPGQLPKWGFF